MQSTPQNVCCEDGAGDQEGRNCVAVHGQFNIKLSKESSGPV